MLKQVEWSPDWSSLVPIQPKGNKPALFCIHGVGGNVLAFEALMRRLGNEQPLYGLQAQGLDGQRRPLFRVEDMAACYINEIRRFQPQGPYFLAGHSFGGVVAYEMARQLQALREPVGLVALFDSKPRRDVNLSFAQKLAQHTKFLGQRLMYHTNKFFETPRKDKIEFFARRFHTLRRRVSSRLWQIASFGYRRTREAIEAVN